MATTVKDSEGHEWLFDVTGGTIRRHQKLLGINWSECDMTDPDSPIMRIFSDVVLLVNVLYVTVKPQADDLKITDEKFGELLGGDVFQKMAEAFQTELASFFQKIGRKEIAAIMTKQKEVVTAVIEGDASGIKSIQKADVLKTAKKLRKQRGNLYATTPPELGFPRSLTPSGS